MTSVRVVIDEVAVLGWSRRRAVRFGDALSAALPEALRAVGAPTVAAGLDCDRGTLSIGLSRRDRRDPERAAAAVAAAIAQSTVSADPPDPHEP